MFLNLVRRGQGKYEFLRTLQATDKKRKQLMRERDKRVAKGEDVFLMRTLRDVRETKEHPLNRAARRFRARLMNRFLRGALRKQLRMTKEQQEQIDKEVDESFEQRKETKI